MNWVLEVVALNLTSSLRRVTTSPHRLLLLLLLSRISRVRLCATPYMAAHQAPLSLGFSRQEYWSGLPFPSPKHACMHAKSLQSCPTLCDPLDSSPPDSPVHGTPQARILEWVAISFSPIPIIQGLLETSCQLKSTPLNKFSSLLNNCKGRVHYILLNDSFYLSENGRKEV